MISPAYLDLRACLGTLDSVLVLFGLAAWIDLVTVHNDLARQ